MEIIIKIGREGERREGDRQILLFFKAEENVEDDNEPIGIILAADKQDILVEYAMGLLSNQLFVSGYQ